MALSNFHHKRSSTKLSYEDAQKIIDGDIAAGDSNIPDAIVQGIRSLYSIAKILRESRVQQGGALLLKRDRLAFEFENGKESAPTAVSMWKEPESAIIVREFLLLANKVVAQKISSHFPELALLRRQAPPVARKIVSYSCDSRINTWANMFAAGAQRLR